MTDALLVLNSGSSSLKFALFRHTERLDRCSRSGGGARHTAAVSSSTSQVASSTEKRSRKAARSAIAKRSTSCSPGDGAGRRPSTASSPPATDGPWWNGLRGPSLVTPETLGALDALVPLAPLHQPHGLEVIRALAERAPEMPQVACFDTAFHRRQPAVAQTFALPRRYAEEGVRRSASTACP